MWDRKQWDTVSLPLRHGRERLGQCSGLVFWRPFVSKNRTWLSRDHFLCRLPKRITSLKTILQKVLCFWLVTLTFGKFPIQKFLIWFAFLEIPPWGVEPPLCSPVPRKQPAGGDFSEAGLWPSLHHPGCAHRVASQVKPSPSYRAPSWWIYCYFIAWRRLLCTLYFIMFR